MSGTAQRAEPRAALVMLAMLSRQKYELSSCLPIRFALLWAQRMPTSDGDFAG